MSLTQLHPEDLFDKESRGTLTDDERTRLEAHVAQCAPCKLERILRADFEDEGAGPISYSDIVAGALGAVGEPDPVGALGTPANLVVSSAPLAPLAPAATLESVETPTKVAPPAVIEKSPRRSVPAWRRMALLMAAAFVLLCTAAAASPQGRSFVRRAGVLLTSSEEPREKAKSPASPARPSAGAAHGTSPATLRAAPAGLEPTPVDAPMAQAPAIAAAPLAPLAPLAAPPPAPLAARAEPAAARPVGAVHTAAPPTTTTLVAPTPPVAPPVEAAKVDAPKEDAATLFAAANDRRRAGNIAGALSAYADVIARFPASREAATAHALSGRIRLDRQDARGALSEFDAYLGTGRGELREEALVGRARALGLLGRTEAERSAWSALLASYPSSASAEHARLRLESLGPR